MLWACNPAAAKTLNMKSINRRRAEGMKLIVVDPRGTYMASHCDIHLQLRPGTDGALALAMANVIISENLYDRAFVAEWTHGFDRFAELLPPRCRPNAPSASPASTPPSSAKPHACTPPQNLPASSRAPRPWFITPTACRTTVRCSA